MKIKEGPLSDALNKDLEGVILRELITYRFVNDVLHKETVSRRFRGVDYHDATTIQPLMQ